MCLVVACPNGSDDDTITGPGSETLADKLVGTWMTTIDEDSGVTSTIKIHSNESVAEASLQGDSSSVTFSLTVHLLVNMSIALDTAGLYYRLDETVPRVDIEGTAGATLAAMLTNSTTFLLLLVGLYTVLTDAGLANAEVANLTNSFSRITADSVIIYPFIVVGDVSTNSSGGKEVQAYTALTLFVHDNLTSGTPEQRLQAARIEANEVVSNFNSQSDEIKTNALLTFVKQ